MKIVSEYLERNKTKISEIIKLRAKQGQLPATELHAFLMETFKIENIKFAREGRDYFRQDDNQSHTEKIIEQYYKSTPEGKKAKFYLYRLTFSSEEIEEYLEYWLATDKAITVQPPPPPPIQQEIIENPVKSMPNVPDISLLGESAFLDNQFIIDEQKILVLTEGYQSQIKKLEQMLSSPSLNAQQSSSISLKIELYKKKIEDLVMKKSQNKLTNEVSEKQKSPSPPKSKTETSRPKKEVNFKLIFEYYAKQNHLAGVKSSFQRIQHESQTINYQKLVHFLKEYQIFPQKPKAQKLLHNLYIRSCSSSRDLHYSEFMQLLQKYSDILFDSVEPPQARKELLMNKIEANSQNNKHFHNPFHSLQKNDFRIDSQNLKYSFKLKPLQGKLEIEVNHQLEARRKQKQLSKIQSTKQKQREHLQKLKKLMAIDPYHPLVVKHSDLLQKRSISVMMQPIANLDNMQKFRDVNFDMRAQFGISDFQEDPLKQISRRYDSNRAQQVQREQSQRMSALMSGLIQRSQAKIQKFSLSPKKRQVSSKLN